MNNELYLGSSFEASESNLLGAAALKILHGAPELGHERKVSAQNCGVLMVAHILLNEEIVGLFIYDEDDGSHVHHQFMSSRAERCLLAHAVELAAPFLALTSQQYLSNWALPEVLLPSTLAHLTAGQRLQRKIKAIRQSNTPVYAVRSHLSDAVVVASIPGDRNTNEFRQSVAEADKFIGWLSGKTDEQIAQTIDGSRLSDQPWPFSEPFSGQFSGPFSSSISSPIKVLFDTPEKMTPKTLRILDNFDAVAAEVAQHYEGLDSASTSAITFTDTFASTSHSPAVRRLIDHALIHGTPVTELADKIRVLAEEPAATTMKF